MSLRQMEYFLAVVEESSFTRAADSLHVTQPALSHQVKALERSVGGPLLERMPRGVRLTAMGRAFLPHAQLAVRSAHQAERAARAAAGVAGGELHLATVHAVAVGLLPGVVARWRALHPGVSLMLREYGSTEALEEELERGAADLAVGPEPARWTGPLLPLGREELVVVVPSDDPLAGRAAVRLAELADRDWIRCAMEPLVDGVLVLDRACGEAGFTPHTVLRTEHTSTAVRMAAAGVGIVMAPAHMARSAVGEDCALLSLDPAWHRGLAVFSRVPLTGAAAAFAELLAGVEPAATATATVTAPRDASGRPD
ncbi:LysR family transcriptional regulator [Streptomyces sp. TN58]|uniref:LysR family transcriptional regulator n=1 Tax=Streptomyces sp. TN58 TaxID=234612 RepID=UPI0009506079|nr:LysR family transcriptional regulator [Streptomyces sp. TN58]APU42780.1 LysR family transcriptional regulator [Streptomyces sp. TN58]